MKVLASGPTNARIMIIGEAPGENEEKLGVPFVGASGAELNRMLGEAGISRTECFVTNVCRYRPPKNDIELFHRKATRFTKKVTKADAKRISLGIDPYSFIRHRDKLLDPRVIEGITELREEIALVKPNIIIPVGNLSLWALTGHWGITKWRGSMLHADFESREIRGGELCIDRPKVIPTYHPAAVLYMWSWRAITVHDLRRAGLFRNGAAYPKPAWNFIVRPSFDQALHTLDELIRRANDASPRCRLRLSFDIETRAGHIACAGISWTYLDAICIPFMCVERNPGYWTLDEEAEVVSRLARLLTHPHVGVVGQYITYDSQYTWRHWHFVPNVEQDTMISQHTMFSSSPKSLDFQASMYAKYYVYWKDEGKNWDPKMGEDQLWYYNCEDCVYTDEAGQVELKWIEGFEKTGWKKIREIHDFQQSMFWPCLKAMQRGIRIDLDRRNELVLEVTGEIDLRKKFLFDVLGFPLNPDSPKQMHALFYSDLKMPIQWKRGKKGEPSKPTLEDDALQKLVILEPLLRPLVNSIADIRTLSKFLSNFLCRSLDIDGRMRCAINIGGSESGKSAPKTFRLSTSEDAFGSGTNFQNIPGEKSKAIGKSKARGGYDGVSDPYKFPNIREIFIPDVGHTWFDLDLERADLFTVCWEAEDELLKAAMRLGVDIHLLNAYSISGKEPPALEELVEGHPKYPDHRGPLKFIREFAKVFCHGTNYLGQPPTMAKHTGRTVHEITNAQRIWFGAHPGIPRWHKRVIDQVSRFHFVENAFGYRWHIFERINEIMPEAVAWIPQSTTSIVINKIWDRINREVPEAEILIQVHDSLPGQFPTRLRDSVLPKIRNCANIVVPYPDPLVIPVKISTSEKSWGHC